MFARKTKFRDFFGLFLREWVFSFTCVFVDTFMGLCVKQIKGKSKRFVWYVVKTIETALMVASVCLCVYFWG